ncbi:MAG: hypothetical protein ACI4SV_02240 [Duodenibacillus sp.]
MTSLFKRLTHRDACGDTPLEMAACMAVFMACMAAIMSLPGH